MKRNDLSIISTYHATLSPASCKGCERQRKVQKWLIMGHWVCLRTMRS